MAIREISTDVLLRDVGTPVIANNISGRGALSQNSEYVLNGQLVTLPYVLLAPADKFAWLTYGDHVIIGGHLFSVTNKAMRAADGVWVQVPVQPADQSSLPIPPYEGELIIDGNTDRDVVVGGDFDD